MAMTPREQEGMRRLETELRHEGTFSLRTLERLEALARRAKRRMLRKSRRKSAATGTVRLRATLMPTPTTIRRTATMPHGVVNRNGRMRRPA
jgi:hypothetical protein